jgi:F0F1-type ATP synthase assembly protein I
MNRSSGSFELVLSALLLGLIGFGVDRWLGTMPVFTVIAVVLGLGGAIARLYYGYTQEMAEHTAVAPWARSDETSGGVDD